MSIDGLITGKLGVRLLDFDSSMESRDAMASSIGFMLFFFILIMLIIIVPTSWTKKYSKLIRSMWFVLAAVLVLGGPAAIGGICGPWLASYYYSVPKWAPVIAFPPYFLSQIQIDWGSGVRKTKDYSTRWTK
jgi:hypothetical protein